jgi:hypothetical protein
MRDAPDGHHKKNGALRMGPGQRRGFFEVRIQFKANAFEALSSSTPAHDWHHHGMSEFPDNSTHVKGVST